MRGRKDLVYFTPAISQVIFTFKFTSEVDMLFQSCEATLQEHTPKQGKDL